MKIYFYVIFLFFMIKNKVCSNNTYIVKFKYHRYDSLFKTVKKLQSSVCSGISYVYSIGKSVKGRHLLVMALSETNPQNHTILKPEFKYVGNMHGNEAVGREMLLHLAEYLCTSYYQNDPKVRFILANTRIHILFSMNPDGFEESKVGCENPKRGNANNVDLNR